MTRKKLGIYLTRDWPVGAFWDDMLGIVFRENGVVARIDRLGPAALTLYDVGMLAGELINGGFQQFFDKSAGDRTYESLAALKRIGSVVTVELLEKALTIFPGGVVPDDPAERIGRMNEFMETDPNFLEDLSEEFYQRVDKEGGDEDLVALRLTFMQANAEEPVENTTSGDGTRPG